MRKLGEAEVFESDLQHLILNYLTINGLAGPAEEFIKEARIDRKLEPCYKAELLFVSLGYPGGDIRNVGVCSPGLF